MAVGSGLSSPPGGWSRRGLLIGTAGAFIAFRALAADHPDTDPGLTPEAAVSRLMDGNSRFVAGSPLHPNSDADRRQSLVDGQQPFATIVTCSDSRVGPELIFDQGLGDLFVIRVAGNVLDDVVLGSVEYSVIHLNVPLVMVLGHEHCGAVAATVAALAGETNDDDKDTRIGALVDRIRPSIGLVAPDAKDKLEAAVLANARRTAHLMLANSQPLNDRSISGRLKVLSARYRLGDGRVTDIESAEA
jgi:carbonic anhydrase